MRLLTAQGPGWAVSTGLFLVRVVVGVAMVLHGWPKVQNPFGWMAGMENAPPGSLQAAAAFGEVGGGILLAVGLLTRPVAVILAGIMAAGLALVHIPNGDPFVAPGKPSSELAAVYLAVNLLILATGPGRCSLDSLLFGRDAAGRYPVTSP